MRCHCRKWLLITWKSSHCFSRLLSNASRLAPLDQICRFGYHTSHLWFVVSPYTNSPHLLRIADLLVSYRKRNSRYQQLSHITIIWHWRHNDFYYFIVYQCMINDQFKSYTCKLSWSNLRTVLLTSKLRQSLLSTQIVFNKHFILDWNGVLWLQVWCKNICKAE